MFSVTAACFLLGCVLLTASQESTISERLEWLKQKYNDICERNNNANKEEYFAIPNSRCLSYLVCEEKKATAVMDCPRGTLFDSGVCKVPDDKFPRNSCSYDERDNLGYDCRHGVNPRNCSEWFECSKMVWESKFACNTGMVYSPSKHVCVSAPEDGQCPL